jgi:hypothetical protein
MECIFNSMKLREGIFVVRPGKPYRFMRFPFRRHMEPAVPWCIPQADTGKYHIFTGKNGTDSTIGIGSAVPEKSPGLPDGGVHGQIKRSDDRFFVIPALDDDLTECIADK